ncbi:MAG: winged helix family two component transcriptional regulator [Bacillota bacterium]|nr:MAG: winged helix family two component transcriptional regulator [Bacillota bacterium]MBS3949276.1 response regulator transcription factor [Peptococcaceae bacterium]
MARKVLIVDDEENIRSSLSYALKQEGYSVFSAETGIEALRLARELKPDVVLLDRMLPGLDGVEVCRQLRADSDVPIIMVTARDSEIDTVVGLEVGADDYITKPFSLSVLLARIRAIMRRSDARKEKDSGDSIAYGPFTLYPSKYVAFKEETDMHLTPKLFEMLLFLVKSPGRVFTRDDLLERVWGMDYAGETRTVDVHITWLRKKMELDPSTPEYLLTVRGVGYKLAEVNRHA